MTKKAKGAAPIRVLIVDDHVLSVRACVGVLELEGDIELVGEAATGRIIRCLPLVVDRQSQINDEAGAAAHRPRQDG